MPAALRHSHRSSRWWLYHSLRHPAHPRKCAAFSSEQRRIAGSRKSRPILPFRARRGISFSIHARL